jgi:hypothetical protein
MGFLISQIFVVINLLLGILGDAYNESKDNMIDGLTKDSDERGRKSYKVLDAVPVYETVLEDIKELLQCDRAAFFVYHRAEHELWTLVGKGNLLRSPAQYGVAGYCVTKQEPAIVVDAYNDYRFHPELDQVTKYTTRHIVACPVYDDNREIVGVIQGMNKLAYNAQTHKWVLAAESFTAVELELLQGYTTKLSNMADEKVHYRSASLFLCTHSLVTCVAVFLRRVLSKTTNGSLDATNTNLMCFGMKHSTTMCQALLLFHTPMSWRLWMTRELRLPKRLRGSNLTWIKVHLRSPCGRLSVISKSIAPTALHDCLSVLIINSQSQ